MKYLTDRTEIAKAMNFNKHPVLYINMEDRPYEGSDYARGSRCRVAWDHQDPRYADLYCSGNLYHCDGRLSISNDAACLSADFGRHDVIEMYKMANTPMIHKGDTVVVVEDYPRQHLCKVRLMKMPDRIDRFCQVVATLVDIEEEN